MAREILGYIDCPHCGETGRMRITPDKNGAPFGYCEECNGQLKTGGNQTRVAAFYRKNPAIKQPAQIEAETLAPTVATKAPEKPPTPPAVAAPKPKAAPRKLSIFEQLEGLTQ